MALFAGGVKSPYPDVESRKGDIVLLLIYRFLLKNH